MESRLSGDLADRLMTRFEHVIIHALQILQVFMVSLITVSLFVLLFIELVYHEVTGAGLLGISSLVLALSTGYFLLRKSLLLPSP